MEGGERSGSCAVPGHSGSWRLGVIRWREGGGGVVGCREGGVGVVGWGEGGVGVVGCLVSEYYNGN